MEQPKPKKTASRYAASAVLADGRLIETLYRPETNETLFAVCRGCVIDEARSVEADGLGKLIPHAPTNSLLAHKIIAFPSAHAEYASEEALVASVRAFIHRYADVSASFEEVASYYVLLTWVYDAFNELPYLRFKGDFGTGKSRCLQTIGSLCYKPMFASGASTVSPLFRIIDIFRGTLVIDEADFRFSDDRAEIVKILNNGNATGFPVLRSEVTPAKDFSPKAFVVFGPKLIATRRSFDDPALESRCITEALSGLPPREDIPLSLPATFHAEALALRNQLLSYRFRTFGTHAVSGDRDRAMESRIAQVMGPLLSVVSDVSARGRIVEYARSMTSSLLAERSATTEAQLLDIIDSMRRDAEPLGIKSIAEQFDARFGNDYERQITPRWIGSQLRRRLTLTTVRDRGTFVIAPSEGPKLDALIKRYGLDTPVDAINDGVREPTEDATGNV